MSNATYTTNDPQYIGRSNPLDPFNGYGDFPNTNAILQPRRSSFSPTTLGSSEKSYHGSHSDIQLLANWGTTKYFSYNIEELPNQVFKITFTLPYDEITYQDNIAPELTTWEIIPNSVARSIFDAGIFITLPGGALNTYRTTIPPFCQAAVMKAVKDNKDVKFISNDPKYSSFANSCNQFYNLIKSGVTSVQTFTTTVKRSAVYSTNDPRAFDNWPNLGGIDATINPVLTKNDMINIYGIPATVYNQMQPSYCKYKTRTPIDPIDTFVLGGYLAQDPTRQYITPTKVQISQVFAFDEWLDALYKPYNGIGGFQLIGGGPYL